MDPAVVDRVIAFYRQNSNAYDYVSNCLQRTYPRGMDTEVFSMTALERAHREARAPLEREHVTPYFYQHPEMFRLGSITDTQDHSHYRITLDTPEDYELIRRIFELLYPRQPEFDLADILKALAQHPDWAALNTHVQQKPVSTSTPS